MHPRKFIRDSVGFAFSQYLVRLLLMVRGVIGAKLLPPSAYGSWNALLLFIDFGVLAQLGTQPGLDQTVPRRIVEGDPVKLDRTKRAGLFNILVTCLLFDALCLMFVARTQQFRTVWGMGGVALVLLCANLTQYAYYQLTLLRSHGNIGAISLWTMTQGLIGAVLGIALVPVFGHHDRAAGVWGLLWGWLAGTVASLVYLSTQSRGIAPVVPRPSRESLALISVGFPMFLFTSSDVVMRTLDRIIIFRFLGPESLGYYTLSGMLIAFLLYLPYSVVFVLYPQLVRRYHEGGDQPAAIREPVERALRSLSLVVPALCGVTFLIAPDVAAWILPKYRAGIGPLQVLGFGALGLAFANLASIVLMTLGRQLYLVPASALMAVLSAALDYVAVTRGFGILGVAWATLTAYLLNGGVMLWLASAGLGFSPLQRLGVLARSFAPLVLASVIAVGLDRGLALVGGPGFAWALARLLVSLAAFTGLYTLAIHPLARGLGARQVLSEFNLPWLSARRAPAPTA